LRHHGDFDEAGVQILRDLETRYGAAPWQFDLKALHVTLDRLGRPEPPVEGSALETAVAQLPSPIAEELLLGHLIADLRAAAISTERPGSS
jgi:hypothetical protein